MTAGDPSWAVRHKAFRLACPVSYDARRAEMVLATPLLGRLDILRDTITSVDIEEIFEEI